MLLQPLMYSYRAQVTFFFFFTLGAFTRERPYREPPEERERHKFRLATLPVYHAFQ